MKRPMMSAPIPFATPAASRPAKTRAKTALPLVPTRRSSTPSKSRTNTPARSLSKTKVRKPSAAREQRRQRLIEALEERQVFAAPTISPIVDQNLLSGAPLQIAVAGQDADSDPLSFSVSSSNSNIIAELRATTNRYLVLNVSHTSSGQSGDSTFSGQLIFQLFEDLTPEVTSRIITLVNQGFYNNLIFHRVINNFVIQGGDPSGNGTGGSGVKFDDEYHGDLQHTVSGLLSMAKTSDDTNDSQFFITEGAQRNLDFNHSIFGMLVSGESLRDQISNVPTDPDNGPDANGDGANDPDSDKDDNGLSKDQPLSNVTITSASIQTLTTYNVLTVKAANGYTGSGTVTVTVSDGKGGTAQDTFTVNATPDTNENRPFLVNEPQQINATASGGAVTHQFQSTDVDGGPLSYYAFLENAADSSKATVSINKTTGLLTVTPVNGFSGVVNVFVVASPLSDADHAFIANQVSNNVTLKQAYDSYSLYYDMQTVPVVVAPDAPTSIDLLSSSDSGSSSTDNLTNKNNNGNSATLTFLVTGVKSGATVQLFDGATLLGEAVASGTTVNITTNSTTVLSNGQHAITARQVLKNTAINAGTQNRTTDITSTASLALNITIDTVGPTFTSQPVTSLSQQSTYNYNANTDDEAGSGASYSLSTAPSGMTIDPNNGTVSWTPTQVQINAGSANVTIQATDKAGNSTTQAYTITFATNQPPTLAAVATQSVNEGSTFTYALVAQDPNLPGDTLTYSLVSGPAGATVNPTTGVVTFTPTETDGGTTKSFTVRVSDAANLFAERTFDLIVNDTNSNPTVPAIGTQTVTENQQLVVQINASDVDIPVDTLSYELVSGPTGTTIDTNGVIRWTPNESHGGTQQTITFKVNDSAGGSTTRSFLVNVTEQNQDPILTVATSHSVNEHQTLTFTASASDADTPTQTLVFGLANAPLGMSINPLSGVVTWKPTEAQGPGSYTIQVIVRDTLGGKDTESVTVTVAEVNQAPTLGTLNTLQAFTGSTLTAQIPGADGDLPAQGLTYQLETTLAGVTIDPNTGVLTMAVPTGAVEGIQSITVRLTDASGASVTQQYQIRVSSLNYGTIYGLVSRWTSTVAPTEQDLGPTSPLNLPTTLPTLVNGIVAPVSVLGDNSANSVTPLLGNGLNRLQAVNGAISVEALKPVVEGGTTGAINELTPPSGSNNNNPNSSEQQQPKSSGNPFDSSSAPTANENQQSRWQRRFDWREQLRAAALVETSLDDGVDLNWVNRAPQTPAVTKIQPEAVITAPTIAEKQPELEQSPPAAPQPLAASVIGAAAAGMLLRKRNAAPISIPVVNDEVRRQRGPRRNWY